MIQRQTLYPVVCRPSGRTRLQQAKDEVSTSLAELRDVARGIYPAVLTGHGLPVALESLAARAPVPVDLTLELPTRPPEAVEVAVYYLISEALANIGKHAHFEATATREQQGRYVVTLVVSGGGFNGTSDITFEVQGDHIRSMVISAD